MSANAKNTVIIRGSPWRVFAILCLTGVLASIIVNSFFFKLDLVAIVAFFAGMAIYFLYLFVEFLPKLDFILSDNWIEGPVPSVFKSKRIRVSYKDIILAGSRVPTIWRDGYLKLYDGRKLDLNFMFLSPAQGRRLMEEVKKRSAKYSHGA